MHVEYYFPDSYYINHGMQGREDNLKSLNLKLVHRESDFLLTPYPHLVTGVQTVLHSK